MRTLHVRQALLRIGMAAKTDPEAAHAIEDQLYREVLEEIAKGESDAAELAKTALLSRELLFTRRCA